MNEYEENYQESIGYVPSPLISKNNFAKIRKTGYSVELSDTLSEGWKIVKENTGLLIGFCFVAFVMSVVAAILFSFIPIVGGFASTAFYTIVLAGFYTFFIKYYQKQFADFSDFFESFRDGVQLGLQGLIATFLAHIPMIFIIIVFAIIAGVGLATNSDIIDAMDRGDFESLFSNGLFISTVFIGVPLLLIPTIIISLFYIFAPIIIITHKKEFWESMELSRKLVMKNLSGIVGFSFVLGVIVFISALPLGLGLFITVPFSYACIFVLYVKLIDKNGEGNESDFSSKFYGDENAPLDAI